MRTESKSVDIKYKFKGKTVRFGLLNYFIVLFAFILFHKSAETLFNKTFVDLLFSKVESVWINDLVFIISLVFVLRFYIKRFSNYVVSKNLSWTILICALIYIYYRFVSDIWTFTPVSFFNSIAYTDLIFVFAIGNTVILLRNLKTVVLPANGKDSFIDDESLGKNKEDELGYRNYADSIADKIKSSNFEKAFAIGINGKWGLGKTSFIDLLKRQLHHNNLLLVDFNPWNSHSPDAIIKDFFETIHEAIRPYHSSLARLMVTYADKLVSINDSEVSKTIQGTVSAISGHESLSSLYKDINDALKRLNKKLVIFIDDLDRLDKTEIVEVIRLVRNTANFHNTFFVVAYDRNYIAQALSEHNPYNHEAFLEKIFQIEIVLPYFDKDILKRKLAEKLKAAFPVEIHKEIDEEISGTALFNSVYLNEWLYSLRDVSRLANSLIVNLNKLIGEIEFSDYVRLEILRMKYASVYHLLFQRPGEFFTSANNNPRNEFTYQLKKIQTSHQEPKDSEFPDAKTVLEVHLQKNRKALSLPENEISRVLSLINEIFGGDAAYRHRSRSHLSVIYPSKFFRYSAFRLLEGNLSEIEFSKARASDQNEFNVEIEKWVKNGLGSDVKRRFSQVKDYDNKEDYEKIITAIFFLANLKSKSKKSNEVRIVDYDSDDLHTKLWDTEKIIEKYYSSSGGAEEFKTFVMKFFINAKLPFLFEADLIRHLIRNFTESFIISQKELNQIAIGYFEQYCNSIIDFDNNIYTLFHCCNMTEKVYDTPNSFHRVDFIPQEAKDIIKNVISKFLDRFLIEFIRVEPFDAKSYSISDFPAGIFGNWDAFEDFLNKQESQNWKYLDEFKKLFQLFKATNFKSWIKFDFKDIPTDQKFNRG
jgi:predicted KAP-like P-loop ATPase